ncbi:glycine betaine ABC transporter substrate-binding protein [Clostridium botulinum]|uniref:ABC transporter permease n=1 Tax=Clostridium botulinum TaxID=1491 RepID=A0A9Q1V0G3_CLOBO|nr:glycine betaine ABC transporter substrate-binding protein [Clostridium botulinum]AEB77031.1 probable glycine betaine/carnitine/choline ABC transporter [Clostridium botulinum BKT015925]KEH98459.1 ABC transporter permease [Clostridium botulinum D str. 16868]KEI04525.1 ABC transporter permease [Clostridium botulinum C/D str. Sp77]KLU76692.1 ABC transporter permease [Clostridium botulinum V891]KOA76125.1 ABC transporter permease [Clostridium botulinum]
MRAFFIYAFKRKGEIVSLLLEHIGLTLASVIVAILIGVPLGILISRNKKLSGPIIGVANIIQAVPSLALLGFLIPILGIGSTPAVFMVFLYSLLPIIKNTYIGLSSINPDMLEAADGMGLTSAQKLKMIQLPLALPIIMAGIRIAAVTAVGLMTIAAFIGAGGLGYMVFTGVQRVNNYMILAGAIPSGILALFIDFISGKIENSVVPEGIKQIPSNKKRKARSRKREKRNKRIAMILVGVICGILVSACAYKIYDDNRSIVVGSKNYTEELILGNMYATLIEKNTNLRVKRTGINLGGAGVTFQALRSGDIDIYPEYTGVALVNIMGRKAVNDPDKAFNIVKDYFNKEYNITWMDPMGYNNTYVLAINKEIAKQYSLKNLSDLSKVSDDLILGCTMEFSDRQDGYLGMKDFYGMKFKNLKSLDGSLRYSALESNEVDVIDAFATDGLLKVYDLVRLKDDKRFFPPYYAAPIIRNDALKKHPELKKVLNILAGKVSEEDMTELNYKVDKLGEDPRKVADDFLIKRKFIK